MPFKISTLALACLSVSAFSAAQVSAEVTLDKVTVTADFRQSDLSDLPASVTVINKQQLKEKNAQHLEDIIAATPNVNLSAGASRGRYYQIRGTGERSQFIQPLHYSVGTYIDGIDFTGISAAATLLDVEQVEIFKGSQGTRFGSSALAGVINITSTEPSQDSKGYFKAHGETYNGWGLQAAHGGAISDSLLYRAAIGKTVSDGFTKNTTLDKKNTNNIDELSSKLKLRWLATNDLTIDASALYLDVDNGYDAFSFDENRKTRSNQPGHDRQETKALSLSSDWKINNIVSLRSIINSAKNNIEYGFDEDWASPTLQPAYQVFDNYKRDDKRDSLELRLLSGEQGQVLSSDWLVGFYAINNQHDLNRNRTGDTRFNSEYSTQSKSIFAEINSHLSQQLTLTSGLRYENWQSDYDDSKNIAGDNKEDLFSAKLTLEYTTDNGQLLYSSITRGYKAGGFNSTDDLPNEDDRSFDTEYQINYEFGGKFNSLNGTLNNSFAIFYTDRRDLQLKSSIQKPQPDGSVTFIDYTANAGKGFNYGLEFQSNWQATDQLSLMASLGLLKTEITEHKNADPDAFDLKKRAQAHAPSYTFATSAKYSFSNHLYTKLEVEGKNKFYYSDSHNSESNSYKLINTRIGYKMTDWEVALYGKNLTNEKYGVRGFAGWDADPRTGPGFDETEFQQLGAPRVIGVDAQFDF